MGKSHGEKAMERKSMSKCVKRNQAAGDH